jgi:hypothetical protein
MMKGLTAHAARRGGGTVDRLASLHRQFIIFYVSGGFGVRRPAFVRQPTIYLGYHRKRTGGGRIDLHLYRVRSTTARLKT